MRDLLNLELQNQRAPAPKSPLLAVDWGEKFSGLAFSPDGVCALPLKVVETSSLKQELEALAEAKHIFTVVMGLPKTSNNEENPTCEAIRKFCATLSDRLDVCFVNERFSSRLVMKNKKKSSQTQRQDDLAAAKILEFYLQGQAD